MYVYACTYILNTHNIYAMPPNNAMDKEKHDFSKETKRREATKKDRIRYAHAQDLNMTRHEWFKYLNAERKVAISQQAKIRHD